MLNRPPEENVLVPGHRARVLYDVHHLAHSHERRRARRLLGAERLDELRERHPCLELPAVPHEVAPARDEPRVPVVVVDLRAEQLQRERGVEVVRLQERIEDDDDAARVRDVIVDPAIEERVRERRQNPVLGFDPLAYGLMEGDRHQVAQLAQVDQCAGFFRRNGLMAELPVCRCVRDYLYRLERRMQNTSTRLCSGHAAF